MLQSASVIAHYSAYPAIASSDWGRATFVSAHFLGLHCLSLALVYGLGTAKRGTGTSRRPLLAALGTAYLTVAIHYIGLNFHSGDSLTWLTLKSNVAEVVFFGTLCAPAAWLCSGALLKPVDWV